MRSRLVLAVALVLVLPATAAADTSVRVIDDDGATLDVRGDAGASQLTVEAADGTATVRDPATVLVPGRKCTAVDPHAVTCTVGEAELVVRLGEGDDSLAVLTGSWSILRLKADAGNDHIDTTGLTADLGSVMHGGDGDDEILGGRVDDIVYGNAGDDVIRAGGGPDIIRGDEGADELLGEDGNDSVDSDGDDSVVDGGDGNDFFDTTASEEPLCGAGDRDQVGITYGVSPGPLFGDDCEDGFDFDPHPVSVGARAITFRVQCNDGDGKCDATLVMRLKRKVVARRSYSATGTKNRVATLPLTRRLGRKLARGALLRMQIDGFHHETAEGTDEVIVDEFWRVRVERRRR
jgi:opacity protein-like surface antigen